MDNNELDLDKLLLEALEEDPEGMKTASLEVYNSLVTKYGKDILPESFVDDLFAMSDEELGSNHKGGGKS